MTIKGGGSLEMSDDNAALFVHDISGDNTGRVTVRPSQSFKTDLDRALMEFSVLTQRDSELHLPPSIDCRHIDLYIKGVYSFSSLSFLIYRWFT